MEKTSRIFIAVIGLVNLLRLCSTQASGQADFTPYLLFASQTSICRVYPNGTGFEVLVEDGGGILAVDYHLRLNYLFWTSESGTLKRARLNDGSNVTNFVERIGYSAGLSVDWINGKIYWTDRDNQMIEMYDLDTNERMTAFSAGPLNPLGLVIYPQEDSGELFWSSRGSRYGKLEKATVTGEGRQLLSNSGCPVPVTLDFVLQTVYWADNCGFTITRSPMNGTHDSESFVLNSDVNEVLFSSGIAEFGENIYWTQASAPGKIYSANKRRGAPIINVLSSTVGSRVIGTQVLQSIKVVHPRSQPSAEELPELHLCTTPCENGICVLPSAECACFSGFSGPDCSAELSPTPAPTVPQESTTLQGESTTPQGESTTQQGESTLLTHSNPTLLPPIIPMHTSSPVMDLPMSTNSLMLVLPTITSNSISSSISSAATTSSTGAPTEGVLLQTTAASASPAATIAPTSSTSQHATQIPTQSSDDSTGPTQRINSAPISATAAGILNPSSTVEQSRFVSSQPTTSSFQATSLPRSSSFGIPGRSANVNPSLPGPTLQSVPPASMQGTGLTSSPLLVMETLAPPTEGIRDSGDDGPMTGMIVVVVIISAGAVLLITVAVSYTVILYCKYTPRKGSYSPRVFERASVSSFSRSSFRVLSDDAGPQRIGSESYSNDTSDTQSFQWGNP